MFQPESRSRNEIEELAAPLMLMPPYPRASGFARERSAADMDAHAWQVFGIAVDEFTDDEVRQATGWLVRSAELT